MPRKWVDHEIVKNNPTKSSRSANFWQKISIFWVIYQPLKLKIQLKVRHFKVENNAQILPRQLQNNFEKVQKTTVSIPKIARIRGVNLVKVSIFGSFFNLRALWQPRVPKESGSVLGWKEYKYLTKKISKKENKVFGPIVDQNYHLRG